MRHANDGRCSRYITDKTENVNPFPIYRMRLFFCPSSFINHRFSTWWSLTSGFFKLPIERFNILCCSQAENLKTDSHLMTILHYFCDLTSKRYFWVHIFRMFLLTTGKLTNWLNGQLCNLLLHKCWSLKCHSVGRLYSQTRDLSPGKCSKMVRLGHNKVWTSSLFCQLTDKTKRNWQSLGYCHRYPEKKPSPNQ